MNKVAFIKTGDGNITLIVNSKNFSIAPSHRNYAKILEALKTQVYDNLEALVNVSSAIAQNFAKGTVTVNNGQVFYRGNRIHNSVTERILEFMSEGLPSDPLIKFLENAMENPVPTAIEELYDFLSHKGFPITEDGCFIGYKGITKEWMDLHTRTISNKIGSVVTFERNAVDPDRRHECSYGLHVGTMEYAKDFAGTDGRMVLVKVNPKNCIAVPKDHNCSKLRVCQYEVLSEAQGLIETPMYPMPEKSIIDNYIEIYNEGQDYFEQDLPISASPYLGGTDQHEAWEEGWTDAADYYAQAGGEEDNDGDDDEGCPTNVTVPKRPPCLRCGAKGGKKHAVGCNRRK